MNEILWEDGDDDLTTGDLLDALECRIGKYVQRKDGDEVSTQDKNTLDNYLRVFEKYYRAEGKEWVESELVHMQSGDVCSDDLLRVAQDSVYVFFQSQ